jgi:hypothetical protein
VDNDERESQDEPEWVVHDAVDDEWVVHDAVDDEWADSVSHPDQS